MVDGMRGASASLGRKHITNYSVIKRLKIFYGGGNEEKERSPIPSNTTHNQLHKLAEVDGVELIPFKKSKIK